MRPEVYQVKAEAARLRPRPNATRPTLRPGGLTINVRAEDRHSKYD